MREWKGLNEEEVARARARWGENRIAARKTKGFAALFFSNLIDPIILVLLASVGINVIFSFGSLNWFETGGILAAVLVSTLVSALSERRGSRAFERLREESEKGEAEVIREGARRRIPTAQIVVGDLVALRQGEKIPADGVMLEGKLTADQSALNGESAEAEKRPGAADSLLSPGAVFQGTLVTSGAGLFRAEKVGSRTLYGRIARELAEEEEPSPLKLRLSRLAGQICRIGYASALAIAAVSLFSSFVIAGGWSLEGTKAILSDPRAVVAALLHAVTLAITVVVVAVPEGLPMMISVVLSANARKMLKSGVLVRKPVGIETCGSMDLLFTDKTGTLTRGEHRVTSVILGSGRVYPKAEVFRGEKLFPLVALAARSGEAFRQNKKAVGGNFTDRALLEFAGEGEAPRVLRRVPFDSAAKCSAAFFEREGKRVGAFFGAPEIFLPRVRRYFDENGRLLPFTEKDALLREAEKRAAAGERMILAALCDESLLTLDLLGVFGISDPLRPDTRRSVETLRGAGVRVVMVTGDALPTAKKIAADARILPPSGEGVCVEAEKLRALPEEELARLLPRLSVVARALPSDKTLLVRAAQKAGRVVGMTGDGVNDAPALKRADVGFAMGSGTALAKEAGDLVILDDSLSAIGRAVHFGRTIFQSIRAFLVFQLTMNFIAVGISVFGALFGAETPITVMQMLWINLIMDTLGGLAFAGEAPQPSAMREKPKKKSEGILNAPMVAQIAGVVLFSTVYLLLFLFSPSARAYFGGGERYFMTVFFSVFIFIAVLNCFLARTPRLFLFSRLFKNRAFCLVIAFVTAVQILIVYRGGAVFQTVPVSPRHLLDAFGAALPVIPFGLILKAAARRIKKSGKD